MTIATETLMAELTEYVSQHLEAVSRLKSEPTAVLNHKADPKTWSALECLEHLNRYGDFYLPEIERRIAETIHPAESRFTSGWLGNYFANSMRPKAKLNKMKTFSAMDPNDSKLDRGVLERFIAQQHRLLALLHRAAAVNLNRTKTSISITPLIKLRLGDTLRVVIYHNERHLQQAKRAISGRRA